MRFTEFVVEADDLVKKAEKKTIPPMEIPTKNVASRSDTQNALSGVQGYAAVPSQAAMDLVTQNNTELDTVDDEEDEIEIPDEIEIDGEPNTLPAEIKTDIKTHGDIPVRFHSLENLPNFGDALVQQLSRTGIFTKYLGGTPIEEINVLANLSNQGPNEQRELNAVAGMVATYGRELTNASIDFENTFANIPGYEAEVQVYEYKDEIFCLVKDFMGSYIYTWPVPSKKLSKK